jgi:uncharacterized protein YcbX
MTAAISGSVRALARWPVKSLGGEYVQTADVDVGGVHGDRRHTIIDLATGKTLTAAETPRLLSWRAEDAVLRDPSGGMWPLGDAATCRALSADLGQTVTIRPHTTGQQYHSGTILITVEGSLRALEEELDRSIDLRRFRPNLHLELDAEPFAELGWSGSRLRVGEAEFALLHPCDRCVIAARDPENGEKWPELLSHLRRHHDLLFGIFAAPLNTARIATGEPAHISRRSATGLAGVSSHLDW